MCNYKMTNAFNRINETFINYGLLNKLGKCL